MTKTIIPLYEGEAKEGDYQLVISRSDEGMELYRERYRILPIEKNLDWWPTNKDEYILRKDELQYLPRLIEALAKEEGGVYISKETIKSIPEGKVHMVTAEVAVQKGWTPASESEDHA